MRGGNDIFTPVVGVSEEITGAAAVAASQTSSNIEDNMKAASNPGSIVWWIVLLAVYLFWDWFQTRDKISSALSPSNVRANLHNLVVIGFAAAIFFNGMNVLCTKLAALKIPVISKAAGTILPLFHL